MHMKTGAVVDGVTPAVDQDKQARHFLNSDGEVQAGSEPPKTTNRELVEKLKDVQEL